MKKYSVETKNKAIIFRKRGFSLNEISLIMKISKGTASIWLNDIKLTNEAKERLKKRGIIGQHKTILTKKRKREAFLDNLKKQAATEIQGLKKDVAKKKELYKLLCSIMFWCEGGKELSHGMKFINSDPEMIKLYLTLLRKSFCLDEKKFRALIHLHEYHIEEKQIEYWSNVTGIPKTQFNKCYTKPNTGKRIKINYPGCIAIRYYDTKVARELWAYYKSVISYLGV